jgi:hypothetical protein
MEPEASWPYSQEPATAPYLQPDAPNPQLPTLLILRSILILSSQFPLGLQNSLFPSGPRP